LCSHKYFRPQQSHFGKTRRTVAVDLRGHGASDAPFGSYAVAGFVDDLEWLCRQLALVKPIVVGHSMGGAIALELAARRPDLVAGIVAIDSMLCAPADRLDAAREFAAALSGPDYLSALERGVSRLFIPSDNPTLRSEIARAMASTPQYVVAATFKAHALEHDTASAVAACRVPIAYIGAEAPMADVFRLRELCAQLKVGQTLGAGHFSTLLAPDQINAMLGGFAHAYCDSAERL
jgi:pimeloyl-ACP methyl ester carboxylesterase